MDKFAFLLKTYRNDLEYACRLVTSFGLFNKDGIKLFIVVDSDDFDFFVKSLPQISNVFLLRKDEITTQYADDSNNLTGLPNGYINQEIVKLSFWKLGLCQNYSCIDSELQFIRDFTVEEFMYNDAIPYTVLIEDRELVINPEYYKTYWTERQKKLDIIRDELGIKNRHLMTCHGMQTFNSRVLEDMWHNYMKPKGIDYIDMLNISPYEFSWYNYYLQKNKCIEIVPCEPHFKTYHMAYQQAVDMIQGIEIDDLSRAYCGVVINSNYTRKTSFNRKHIESIDWRVNKVSSYKTLKKIEHLSRGLILKEWIKSIVK